MEETGEDRGVCAERFDVEVVVGGPGSVDFALDGGVEVRVGDDVGEEPEGDVVDVGICSEFFFF